ncbi:MAG TPA: hypothetical protein VF156_15515 [Agromyces sp.]
MSRRGGSITPGPLEHLYWSEDPAEVAELRARCRDNLERFGGGTQWGSALMPLIGSSVLLRGGIPARIVQTFATETRVVINEGMRVARAMSVNPQEVMLPWHPEHQPAFQSHRGRRPSSTPSSATSSPSPTAAPARPTAPPTVAQRGPTSSPSLLDGC